jgi:hypothetical protein
MLSVGRLGAGVEPILATEEKREYRKIQKITHKIVPIKEKIVMNI